MSAERNSPGPQDFDQALGEVERIIARIESGEVGLEQSISEYERGAGLLRLCRERLNKAEQKVKDLTAQLQADVSAHPGPSGTPGHAPERRPPADGDKDAPF